MFSEKPIPKTITLQCERFRIECIEILIEKGRIKQTYANLPFVVNNYFIMPEGIRV